jgi:hypothetical protein
LFRIWPFKKTSTHFWTEEKGLTSMFLLLFVSNFIVFPFIEKQHVINFIIRLIWLVLLLGGIHTMSIGNKRLRILYSIPLLLIVVNIIRYVKESQVLTTVDFINDVAVFSLLIGMVLVKVFEGGPVTVHRVIGAIVAFMLLGNLFAVIYHFIYIHIPGSFQLPASSADSGPDKVTFLYFSYTTLTTTGYGEIVPLNALARTLVNNEQLIGVLYPAILIGRLVSLVVGKRGASPN